jgi:hypothetical protein
MKVVLICLLLAAVVYGIPTYDVEADGPGDYQYGSEQLEKENKEIFVGAILSIILNEISQIIQRAILGK